MATVELLAPLHAEMTAWRRDIHAHPELGFEEHRTADLVAAKLEAFGIDEVHRGVGGTGVVGVLRAGRGTRASACAPTWTRCRSRKSTASPTARVNQGVMHACGHDGHTTMLLGAARYLAEPATSTAPSTSSSSRPRKAGRRPAMIEDGLFERFPCDAVFGMHNRPGLPVGQFASAPAR